MEIGVYKGRSAIAAACFLNDNESFWAIDPFEKVANDVKIAAGGVGDRDAFTTNWKSVFGHTNNLKIFAQTSEEFFSDEAVAKNEIKFNYVSIDGDHSKPGTMFDLNLANRLIGNGGVIVVDDCFNIEWPSVQEALNLFLHRHDELVPFAAGWNKLYLCRTQSYHRYYSFLEANTHFLKNNVSGFWSKKSFEFHGKSIIIFNNRWKPGYLPELARDEYYWGLNYRRLKKRKRIFVKLLGKIVELLS